MDKDSSSKKGLLSSIVDRGNNVLNQGNVEKSASNSQHSVSGGEPLLNRRQCLKAGATAVAVSPFVGVAAGSFDRHGIEFDQVVDAVDDLGMDPTGETPINDPLQQSMNRGDELVKFPEGEYLLTEDVVSGNVTNWGILGLGSGPEDVRILNRSAASVSIASEGGQGQFVENVTMDYSANQEGTIGLILKGADQVYAIDVHFDGYNPIGSRGDTNNLSLQALDPDGQAIAQGIVREGPSAIASHASQGPPSNSPVSWLGPEHQGTLTYRDCHFENAGANVIYASRTRGTIQVEDCTFVNNNQSSVRISGDGSYVRNCEFVIDTDNDHPDNQYPEGEYINPHAMMWESGTEGRSGARIEDCDIVYRSRPNNDKELHAVRGLGSIGDFEVRDTTFQIETDDTVAILGENPENPSFGSTPSTPWSVTVEDVDIVGSGDADSSAIQLDNRPESYIGDVEIQLTGNQDGISISNSQGCRIEKTNIDVQGEETVFSNADVETSGFD